MNETNNMSENINELAAALSKAQGAMDAALKDANNPFFKKKYADLSSVWAACKKPLTDNGLCVVQQLGNDEDAVTLTTILMHSSGQWIKSTARAVPGKKDPQSIGSTATYLRRYGLSALVGVCTEDDDGNAGSTQAPRQQQSDPKPFLKNNNEQELLDWRNTVAGAMLSEYSPFHKNKDAAAQYVKEKTGRHLKDLNAVELEQLFHDFQDEFIPKTDEAKEQMEMMR